MTLSLHRSLSFRMVRELIAVQNYDQIERICRVLSDQFVLSQNGNFRRGGLIGIAALAIACGKVRLFHLAKYSTANIDHRRKPNGSDNIWFHLFYNAFSIMIQKSDTMRANPCTTLPKSCDPSRSRISTKSLIVYRK